MMLSIFVAALPIFFSSCVCNGSDTLLFGQTLFLNQTLVSKGGIFELGFFSPPNSNNYYLGIWYKSIPIQTVVWVFNRETPILFYNNKPQLQFLSDDSSVLCLNVENTPTTLRCVGGSSNISEAVILDSGNFVLRNDSGGVLWQSFDYPTDTWLPATKPLYITPPITSWRNSTDPASGNYSFYVFLGLEDSRSLSVWAEKTVGWERGICSTISDHSAFSNSHILALHSTDIGEYEPLYFYNKSMLLSRVVIEYDGHLTGFAWSEARQDWIVVASTAHRSCWSNTICDARYSPACRCLDGFVPRDQHEWDLSDFSNGCHRKIILPLQCDEHKIRFIKVTVGRLPANRKHWTASNDLCRLACSRNCSCSAYAYDTGGACLWYTGDLLALETPSNTSAGVDIYIRTESSHNAHTRTLLIVALTASIASVLIISCLCFCYIWPNLKTKDSEKTNQDLLLLDLNSDGSFTNKEGEAEDGWHELPIFSLGSIAASTNNFSITNKLGQGGFGPVYKGELANGQFVAVKRLSKRSRQGLEEFRNEMQLIAKLQHRNLVRILGCCDEKDEMILVYEYMPNKSLDCFLFEPSQKVVVLDWNKRIHIISGIAQGILYLHQYSRLRIVHRDLKASNILLDADMNPKISDFGLARIFGGNELQANTKRIVGTYGYMSPEYAMEGLFSVKSDVFAFGVLVLEIISGKKNTGFYGSEYLCLLRYAWDLWKKGCVDELIDPTLELPESWSSVAMRYEQQIK
ncbi:G-type lectin S-receptor-like serine/threonine-protein kinase At1g11330 [Salvia hispanica]|uniref:G-type lectin S-receptor-like serine/threonine-protein kinase At1g11330 n=1 Tax=Salvia hispanica TaxID=49212 RepID=UPI002009615E|nr:G-type lectin S-receptor-like serine/threonine-protein kinase At1g11330 [Salvia hispanica]